jgi:helix-turn-helix protein
MALASTMLEWKCKHGECLPIFSPGSNQIEVLIALAKLTAFCSVSRRRAERAMVLLRSTRRSIIEICLAVGYASANSFSASLAARYAAPPSRVARPLRPLTEG